MSGDSASSPVLSQSFVTAMRAPHPLRGGYRPRPAPPPGDVAGLQARIAACLSGSSSGINGNNEGNSTSGGGGGTAVAQAEGPAAVARLERLRAESAALVAAADAVAASKRGGREQQTQRPQLTNRTAPTSAHTSPSSLEALAGGQLQVQRSRYSALRPPPAVTEAEVDAALAALGGNEVAALRSIFQMSVLDDFEFICGPEEEEEGRRAEVDEEITADDDQQHQQQEGTGGDNRDCLTDRSGPPTAVPSATTTAIRTGRGSPAITFTLEQMPMADGADRRHHHYRGDGAGLTPPASSVSLGAVTAAGGGGSGGCTVEVEYTGRGALEGTGGAPASSRRNGRGGGGDAGFTVPPHPSVGATTGTGRNVDYDEEGGDEDEDEDDGDRLSFGQFSRMVLQQEQASRLLGRLPHMTTAAAAVLQTATTTAAAAAAGAATAGAANASQKNSGCGGGGGGGGTAPACAANASAASTAAVEALTKQQQQQRDAEQEQQWTAFLRQRVRDSLVANRALAREGDRLAAALLSGAHTHLLAATAPCLTALERLTVLAQESAVLLGALEAIDRAAVAERVADPAQFLLVPRFRAACARLSCNAAFSALVPREGCRRCGQTFCPKCCRDRGLGPPVTVAVTAGTGAGGGGQREELVSLGWEPLCRQCFAVCEESQCAVAEAKRRRLLLPPPPPATSSSDTPVPVPVTAAAATAGRPAAQDHQAVYGAERDGLAAAAALTGNNGTWRNPFSEGEDDNAESSGDRTVPCLARLATDDNANPPISSSGVVHTPRGGATIASLPTTTAGLDDAAVSDSSNGGWASSLSLPAGLDLNNLSIKEVVLFGAYCGESRALSDGLPPFYVASADADHTAAFWDVLTYRVARMRGSLLAGYQRVGTGAQRVIAAAAAKASRRVGGGGGGDRALN